MDLIGVYHNVNWNAESRRKCLRVAGDGLFGAALEALSSSGGSSATQAASASPSGGSGGKQAPRLSPSRLFAEGLLSGGSGGSASPGAGAGGGASAEQFALDTLQLLDECAGETLALRAWRGDEAAQAAGEERLRALCEAVGAVAAGGGGAARGSSERVRAEAVRCVASVLLQALEAAQADDETAARLCEPFAAMGAQILRQRNWRGRAQALKRVVSRCASELAGAWPTALPAELRQQCEVALTSGGAPAAREAAGADALALATPEGAAAVLRVASDPVLADGLTRQLLLMAAARAAQREAGGQGANVDERALLEGMRVCDSDSGRAVRTKLLVAARWVAHAMAPGAARDESAAFATLVETLGALEDMAVRGWVAPRAFLAAVAEAMRALPPESAAWGQCTLSLCRALSTNASLHPHLLTFLRPLGDDAVQRVLRAVNESVIAAMLGARGRRRAGKCAAIECLELIDAILGEGAAPPTPALAALLAELQAVGGARPTWDQCCGVLRLVRRALARRCDGDAEGAVLARARGVCNVLAGARFPEDIRAQARRALQAIAARLSGSGGAMLGARYAASESERAPAERRVAEALQALEKAEAQSPAAAAATRLIPAGALVLQRVQSQAKREPAAPRIVYGDALDTPQLDAASAGALLEAYDAELRRMAARFELDTRLSFRYRLPDEDTELPRDLFAVRLSFTGPHAPSRATSHLIPLVRSGAEECEAFCVRLPILQPSVAAAECALTASDVDGCTWACDAPLRIELGTRDFFFRAPLSAVRAAAVAGGVSLRGDAQALDSLFEALWRLERLSVRAVKELAGGRAGALCVLESLREFVVRASGALGSDDEGGSEGAARCLIFVPPSSHLLLEVELQRRGRLKDMALVRVACDCVPVAAALDELIEAIETEAPVKTPGL